MDSSKQERRENLVQAMAEYVAAGDYQDLQEETATKLLEVFEELPRG